MSDRGAGCPAEVPFGRPLRKGLQALDRPGDRPAVVPAQKRPQDGREHTQEAAVDKGNEELARVEQIKKFAIVRGDWLPGGDELTPTMKLKRKPIAEKYAREIESMYGG